MNPLWIECGKVLEKQIEHGHTSDCTQMDMGLDGTVGE